jgi:hypothetical protein
MMKASKQCLGVFDATACVISRSHLVREVAFLCGQNGCLKIVAGGPSAGQQTKFKESVPQHVIRQMSGCRQAPNSSTKMALTTENRTRRLHDGRADGGKPAIATGTRTFRSDKDLALRLDALIPERTHPGLAAAARGRFPFGLEVESCAESGFGTSSLPSCSSY